MKNKMFTFLLAVMASASMLFAETYSGACGENLTWSLNTEDSVLTISGTGLMESFNNTSDNPWYVHRTAIKSAIIGSGVTSIGKAAFYDCTSLTSVTIPNSVASIGDGAFNGCSNLTTITNFATTPQPLDPDGISVFGGVPLACTLYVPAQSIAAYQTADVWKEFGNIVAIEGDTPEPCIIASGTCGAEGDNLTWTLTCDSVLTISGMGAMADYSGTGETPWNSYRDMIKILTLEEGVTTTGWNAFGLCTNMVTINIPSSLTYFHIFGFSDCISLRSINVSVDNQYYCSVDDVLFNKNKTILVKYPAAKSDVSYSIPNGVLELGMYSFEANTKLISVDIPNSVKSINNFAFRECSGLTSVTIPNSTTKIGRGAFYQCSSLTSIEIPYSVTTIDLMPFWGCSKLTSIDIAPENLNYCSVDGVLFDINKTTLIQYPIGNARTKYTIPNSVTNISESAFNACNNITSIEIPNSVTSLGSYSLYIHNLRYITNYATIPQSIENNVFGYVYKPNCTLYVPAQSVAAYQAADVWKEFGNILAIDDSTEEVNYATLADIYNMAADSTFTLGAFDVMYVPDFQSGSNMYIKDSTGSCVIYKVNYGLQAGDHVEAGLQGKVHIYNGLYEITPISTKEELTITSGEAPAPMVATEVPSLNNASQYVVYEGVSFTTDTAFVEGRRHTVYGSWNGQTITFYNQYYIGATLSANKTYNITAVNTIYRTTPQAYPLAVEEVDSVQDSCIIASGTCGAQGDNLTWTLTCDSVLTISGTGRMANYVLTNSKSPAPWYTYHTAIKSVVIEDGVTSIGKNAFSECDMALVMMSGSVSAIADYAFSSCKKIISVDVAIDNQNYCSVDGILFNKNKTTLILYPAAKSDTSYSIPESVTRIGTASFEYCDSLSNIHIPNSVISIGRIAFYGSSTLTYIAIPNSVTSIEEGAFIDCRGLTSVTIGNSVTSIVSSAFYNCSSLTTITNYAATPQTISSYVFTNVNISSCTLYVPAQSLAAYQTADVWKEFGTILPIEGGTPEPCVIASGTCGAEGDNLTWTLSCDSVLTISGTGAMADYGSSTNKAPWDSLSSAILSVAIENGITRIGKFAFNHNYNYITSVTIPNSVTQIGEGAFYSCDYLNSIIIPNSVTAIEGSAFRYCGALTSVSIPNSVLTIGYDAFEYCDNLETVYIPSSVISIGNSAFAGNKKMRSISVDEANLYYCSIDGVLFNKDQTKLLQYPNGKGDTLYIIPNTVTTLGSMSFSYILKKDSVKLTSIVIPSSVTTINVNAFWNVNNLASITNYAVTPQWVSAPYAYISSCTLYVPAQSLEAYQAADFWKEFTNILPIEGTEEPIETIEGNYTIYYVGKDSQDLTDEIVTLHVPVAPVIEGFTFLKWVIVAGDLEDGIAIQAVYEADMQTGTPEVYTNPANHAQKLLRDGHVYILTDDRTYTIQGQRTK